MQWSLWPVLLRWTLITVEKAETAQGYCPATFSSQQTDQVGREGCGHVTPCNVYLGTHTGTAGLGSFKTVLLSPIPLLLAPVYSV